MSTSDENTCVLCGVRDDNPTSVLGDRGCQSIIAASKNKGRTLVVSPGQQVHKDCRRIYCHPNQNRLNSSSKENLYTSPSTRQSLELSFDFQTKCFFCGTNATHEQHKRKRGRDVHPVLTLEFQKSIKDVCLERNDDWGDIVLGRLECVCDLPAAEARYHQSCSSNFRSGYKIPKCFQSPVTDDGAAYETDQCSKTKKGRPACVCADNAFKTVLEEFEETEIGFITISDLVQKMASICGEDNSYSTTYMKRRMLEHYGNSIIITELNGKSNVVTFRSRAHAILHNYYHRQNKNDSESEKLAIIKTAGKLILNDIKDMEENAEIYPSANDMSTGGNRKYVPPSLVTLLQQLIDQKDSENSSGIIRRKTDGGYW
ncbi:uncharacterized protein LOC123543383 [Mercenaria mercenaria]|uniref:uncharacterized protein LOC123543383 n=1 Tax=Mercenaria mercenaria TaxID=6596 RepID=UPI00234E8E03|nr:uncharacterized protein LOC123543383 [Mercenaria mercenaria]